MAIDPLTASVIATGVINGASAIGSGVVGLMNNKYNKQQNEWNKSFAREQFEYQKYNTENAAQIRARDLEAAGLSKTLAAGDSASTIAGVSQGAQGQNLNKFEKEIIGNQIAGQLAQIKQVKSQSSLNSKQEQAIDSENDLRTEQGNTQKALQGMYKSQSNYYDELAKSQPSYRRNLQTQSELNEVMKEYNVSRTVAQDWDNFYNELYDLKSNDKPHWIWSTINGVVNAFGNTFMAGREYNKLSKDMKDYLSGIGVNSPYEYDKFIRYLKNRRKEDWK